MDGWEEHFSPRKAESFPAVVYEKEFSDKVGEIPVLHREALLSIL